MILTRRSFLSTAGTATLAVTGLRHLAFAAAPSSNDALVAIFLRGGCDGLSLVAPTNDPNYVDDRPPELRVLADGDKPGRSLKQQVAPQIDFRFHSEAAPLAELYDQGQLAVIHAVGLTNGTRSHFAAQALMDHGVAEERQLINGSSGWLTRLLTVSPSAAPAIATGGSLPANLDYHRSSLAIPDLGNGLGLAGGNPKGAMASRDVLSALYRAGEDRFSQAGRATLDAMQDIDRALPRGPDGKLLPYQPDNKAGYDGSEIGRALTTVARLIKMDIGVSVAAIDMGGWDQHENMAPRFATCAGQLARNLSAFWNDLQRSHDRLCVVVMSEFGRRLRSNRSNGTDHGHGGVMLTLGHGIQGGTMHGSWPGLASEQLDNAVDLAVTTDYRQVLAEIISVRLGGGQRLGEIFPNFQPAPFLGLTKA